MIKNTKIELQAKTIRRLQDDNIRLSKENKELKKQLQEHKVLMGAAEKYRDEHKKAIGLLNEAKEMYNEALSDILAEKKRLKEEFEKLMKGI